MKTTHAAKTVAEILRGATVRESIAGVAEIWTDGNLILGRRDDQLVISGPSGIVETLQMTRQETIAMRRIESARYDLDQTLQLVA